MVQSHFKPHMCEPCTSVAPFRSQGSSGLVGCKLRTEQEMLPHFYKYIHALLDNWMAMFFGDELL